MPEDSKTPSDYAAELLAVSPAEAWLMMNLGPTRG
jgi:hypothetical protein